MPKIHFKKREKRPNPNKEKGLTFSSKIIPKEGLIAIGMGVLSLIFFLGLSVYSTYKRGDVPILAGILGMVGFLFSLIGFILSLRTMKKDNVFLKVPIYGVAINTAAVILYLILYFYGIILMML